MRLWYAFFDGVLVRLDEDEEDLEDNDLLRRPREELLQGDPAFADFRSSSLYHWLLDPL